MSKRNCKRYSRQSWPLATYIISLATAASILGKCDEARRSSRGPTGKRDVRWSETLSLFVCRLCSYHAVSDATSYLYFNLCVLFIFYFLITYGVCKKRKYCNRTSEKKNSVLLTNVHVLYVLEDKTGKKKFRLSVCLVVWLYVRGLFMWTQ